MHLKNRFTHPSWWSLECSWAFLGACFFSEVSEANLQCCGLVVPLLLWCVWGLCSCWAELSRGSRISCTQTHLLGLFWKYLHYFFPQIPCPFYLWAQSSFPAGRLHATQHLLCLCAGISPCHCKSLCFPFKHLEMSLPFWWQKLGSTTLKSAWLWAKSWIKWITWLPRYGCSGHFCSPGVLRAFGSV